MGHARPQRVLADPGREVAVGGQQLDEVGLEEPCGRPGRQGRVHDEAVGRVQGVGGAALVVVVGVAGARRLRAVRTAADVPLGPYHAVTDVQFDLVDLLPVQLLGHCPVPLLRLGVAGLLGLGGLLTADHAQVFAGRLRLGLDHGGAQFPAALRPFAGDTEDRAAG